MKNVAKLKDLPEDIPMPFNVDGIDIILIRRGDRVYALSRFCTHEGADLTLGFLAEDRLICPLHLSQFDIATGDALNPPAEEPLKTYVVKLSGDDVSIDI